MYSQFVHSHCPVFVTDRVPILRQAGLKTQLLLLDCGMLRMIRDYNLHSININRKLETREKYMININSIHIIYRKIVME